MECMVITITLSMIVVALRLVPLVIWPPPLPAFAVPLVMRLPPPALILLLPCFFINVYYNQLISP